MGRSRRHIRIGISTFWRKQIIFRKNCSLPTSQPHRPQSHPPRGYRCHARCYSFAHSQWCLGDKNECTLSSILPTSLEISGPVRVLCAKCSLEIYFRRKSFFTEFQKFEKIKTFVLGGIGVALVRVANLFCVVDAFFDMSSTVSISLHALII